MTIYSFDIFLPSLEPVCCSMSSTNCCLLTCIQLSQEAGQVVWYSHLFQNFPQFVVSRQSKALAIWSLFPLPFLNLAWTSGRSQVTYCWSLAWRILSITLKACEKSEIVWWLEHSLALPFFGMEWNWLFQSCGHCWVFQIAGTLSVALSQHHI